MPNILGFVGIGVTGVVLLCAILATALNFWMTRKSENTEVAVGLWEFCAEVLGAKSCTDIDSKSVSDNHWKHYQAVRAMVLLGVLLAAGAIVAGILVMFVMKNTKLLFFVAAGLDIAAGLFLMTAMAIFVDQLHVDSFDYGAAFALDIIAWIGAWVAGGLFVGAKIMDKDRISHI